MPRILFDPFHRNDQESELVEVFCATFKMQSFLSELSPTDYLHFQNEARVLFSAYETMYPNSGFTVEEGIELINNLQQCRPGSATEFAKRITPHTYLRFAFLQL
jgi:hypothetical protein